MREILFRGKRTDNGEWTEGNLFVDHDPEQAIIMNFDLENTSKGLRRVCDCEFVDPETVGQYTGLTDKNGKKVFEGDIVDQNWYDYTEPSDHSFGEVIFRKDDCCFSVLDIEKGYIVSLGRCGSYYWEIEVIGNIHDNPELLKGEPNENT